MRRAIPLATTILFPGFDGGFEWGGAVVDPDGILYITPVGGSIVAFALPD